jgi:hypothetical protein
LYNRYIPQQDGTFRRKQEPDMPNPPRPKPPEPPPCPPPHREPPKEDSVSGFLKRLIPRDFDTGDLIVVLLLLLMAGDKPEDKSTALLTLALYCFL